VQDVGGIPAFMISTSGFSFAAQNHLKAEEIETLIISIKEAEGLRWIPFVEELFAADRSFREVTGHLVEALRYGDESPFMDSEIPYEEWLAVFGAGLSLFPQSTGKVLRLLARNHFDSGVRFNAVMLLWPKL
jgi:hypothetical protein